MIEKCKRQFNTSGLIFRKNGEIMQKILFINGHPNPEASVAGKAVLNALESSRCEMQIRTLAQLCGPNGFDVTTEQEALRRADVIVWHFPFYWYSVPAILKKWIDDVLTRGFAHGTGGTALHGKKQIKMKNNDWKSRLGVMYSTNPDFQYETNEEIEEETLPKEKQVLRVALDKRNRGGKVVTLITGFRGTTADLEALGKLLKVKCGVGGSAKDGEIIVQGDFRQKVEEILRKEGYTQVKVIR